MTPDPASEEELLEVLARARAVGFLGPGPLRAQIEHARAFLEAIPAEVVQMVDLGSGGGVPALPILLARPHLRATLVDAMHRRTVFLRWAVAELGLEARVDVRRQRAEEAAHDPLVRASADVVTARGFAAPPVTAECAAGFLRRGGSLVVSEPPEAVERWPVEGVARLGFAPAERFAHVVRLRLEHDPPPSVPRSSRLLAKRPLF